MKLSDIFIKDEENGFHVKTTKFTPNASDTELKEMLDEVRTLMETRASGLVIISASEFKKHQDVIAKNIAEDAKTFGIIAEELMSLRKLIRKIQKERDILVEYIAKNVLGGTPCNK